MQAVALGKLFLVQGLLVFTDVRRAFLRLCGAGERQPLPWFCGNTTANVGLGSFRTHPYTSVLGTFAPRVGRAMDLFCIEQSPFMFDLRSANFYCACGAGESQPLPRFSFPPRPLAFPRGTPIIGCNGRKSFWRVCGSDRGLVRSLFSLITAPPSARLRRIR